MVVDAPASGGKTSSRAALFVIFPAFLTLVFLWGANGDGGVRGERLGWLAGPALVLVATARR